LSENWEAGIESDILLAHPDNSWPGRLPAPKAAIID
jgi:hypothetical protein